MASKVLSKIASTRKPVPLMEALLASPSARRFSSGGAPPHSSSDGSVKGFTGEDSADPRPTASRFSPRGWWVFKEDGDVAMPGLGKEGAYKDSTAPLRRCFSSGPRSSSDDGVKESTGEDPVAAALHFSDGEECRDSETDYDEVCRNSGDYGEDHPGFTVILPHGAVWKAREYPDSVKVRVVVPSKMWKAKKFDVDMEWQYEEDEMGEKNLNIWIAEVDEITGEMKIEDMVADPGKYTPPKPSECIYFDAGRYEKDNMEYKRWQEWRDWLLRCW